MNTPNRPKLVAPLQRWLDSLPPSIPLHATTDVPMIEGKKLEERMVESNIKSDSLVAALLWLRIGHIEAAHEIVQEGTTTLASYLHGVVHRLEGDYWNAKYWFRQVRDNRLLPTLSQSMKQKLDEEGLLSTAMSLGILKADLFDPSGMVAAVEQQSQNSERNSDEVNQLERICWLEWTSLWEYV